MESKSLELVKAYMLHKGLKSGSDLARSMHVTRATASNWIRGNTHITADIALIICDELGLNLGDTLCAIEQDRAINLKIAQAWGQVRRMYIMSRTRAQFERRKAQLTHIPTKNHH
jgi:plasmid maintenance system antidote protein VapI